MDNNSVAVVENQKFVPLDQHPGFQQMGVKRYKNGGCGFRLITKKEFKEFYLINNPTASGRDVSRAYNAEIKRVGEQARQATVAFYSNPDILVMGGRQNKDGSKGATSYQRKSSLKMPKDKRKATVTLESVVASLSDGKFTRKDLELMLDAVAIKLDETQA